MTTTDEAEAVLLAEAIIAAGGATHGAYEFAHEALIGAIDAQEARATCPT